MDERRLEVKVGALMLLGALCVAGLLWLMGELAFQRPGALTVQFAHTGNVVVGAPVKLGGVAVGRVEEIALDPARRDADGLSLPVSMSLSVEDRAREALREDAQVTVATVGPLGEPYLELYPGSANAPKLPTGATLRGTDAPRLDLVALRLSAFLESASRVLDENPEALGTVVGGVTRLTGTVDQLLSENRGDLKSLAGELSLAAKDLRALAHLARRHLEPGGKADRLLTDASEGARLLRTEAPALSRDARALLARLSTLSGQFSEEDVAKLKKAIDKYAAAGDKLDGLATRAERLLGQIERGEGTLGQLQNDKELYGDLKALVEDLRKHPWKILWKD